MISHTLNVLSPAATSRSRQRLWSLFRRHLFSTDNTTAHPRNGQPESVFRHDRRRTTGRQDRHRSKLFRTGTRPSQQWYINQCYHPRAGAMYRHFSVLTMFAEEPTVVNCLCSTTFVAMTCIKKNSYLFYVATNIFRGAWYLLIHCQEYPIFSTPPQRFSVLCCSVPPPPHTYHYNGFSLLKNTIFLFYMKSFFQMFCIFAPAHVLRSNRMLMWMARPPRTYYRHNCAPFLVHALMRCILPVQLYKHYLIKNEKIPPYHISYYLTWLTSHRCSTKFYSEFGAYLDRWPYGAPTILPL